MRGRKKVLFVMNTMGRGGAEVALLELMKRFDPATYECFLYVMLGQGELVSRLPDHVQLLNRRYSSMDVLSSKGKRRLYRHLLGRVLRKGALFKNFGYCRKNYRQMKEKGSVRMDKLLWRPIADGTDPIPGEFDLAVAFLEGAATYYVSEKVKAKAKAAFIHVDYQQAGYSRELDLNDYEAFAKVFCVSDEVRKSFIEVYPEYAEKTEVFHNLIDRERILAMSEEAICFPKEEMAACPGFSESLEKAEPLRLVTLGRLVKQKAFEVSIEAMRLLRERGVAAKWYVFGEGEERRFLEKKIEELGLSDSFFLPGVVDNPYPYVRKADIYVHCSKFEGRSIAIQEALLLGRPVVVSDCPGNREQVEDGYDGLLIPFTAEAIADAVEELAGNAALREKLGKNAAEKSLSEDDSDKLLGLLAAENGGEEYREDDKCDVRTTKI